MLLESNRQPLHPQTLRIWLLRVVPNQTTAKQQSGPVGWKTLSPLLQDPAIGVWSRSAAQILNVSDQLLASDHAVRLSKIGELAMEGEEKSRNRDAAEFSEKEESSR